MSRSLQSEHGLFSRVIQPSRQLNSYLCRRYDTVGLFGRRLKDLVSAAKHSLQVSDRKVDTPRRIFYPTDYFPLADDRHQKLVEQFVQNLESYLDARRVEVNIAQLWQDFPPSPSPTARLPLQQYLSKASITDTYATTFGEDRADFSTGTFLVLVPRLLPYV